MKTTKLDRAMRNNYGHIDATPGTDMANRLMHVSASTIHRYIRRGWLKRTGSGLVLTQKGYMEV